MGTERDINVRVRVKDDGSIVLESIGDTGEKSFDKVKNSSDKATESVGLLNRNVGDLVKGFVLAELAMDAARAIMREFKDEALRGFDAVEDFNLSVASMTGFMTTFSEKAAEGDLASAFAEANAYAKELIPTLEVMDAKTIATGRDLKVIVETMMMYGTVIDVNNQKQVEGLLNITNVLKMITTGQNQDIQLRQEINALMAGQLRMTDRLPKLLSAIDPQLEEHLKLWKEEGNLIENVGALLEGFGESTDLISMTWTAIGSTMETVHTRVLRGGMLPVYDDILDLATATNRMFMDQDGNLTDIAETLQTAIKVGWIDTKNAVEIVYNLVVGFETPLSLAGDLVIMIADGWGMVLAVVEPLTAHIGDLIASMFEGVKMTAHWADGIYRLFAFDFKGSKAKMAEAEAAFWKGGELAGKAFSVSWVDEVNANLDEYFAAKRKGPAKDGKAGAPKMAPPPPEDTGDSGVTFGPDTLKEAARNYGLLGQEIWSYQEDIVKRGEELKKEQARTAIDLAKQEMAGWEKTQKSITEITRAALPEQERAIHDVHQAYADLSAQAEQLYIIGEISKDVADQLHENLAVRMNEDLDEIANKGKKTFSDDLKTAITGWGSDFSAELTDLVWQADTSFGDIALSYGRMLTQMIIQEAWVNPAIASFSQGSIFSTVAGIFGGGRATGGPVTPNTMYEVTEDGVPELLTVGNNTYLMMGGQGGHVTPPFSAAPGAGPNGSGGMSFIFQNTFQVTATGSGPSKNDNGAAQQASQEIGRLLQNQMRAFVVKEHHPGGLFDQLRKS